MLVKTDKSPTLGLFIKNPGVKQIPSDPAGVSEVFFGNYFSKYCVKKLIINNQWHNSPLTVRTCQSTVGLSSICLQTRVEDHPVSLGVTYGQHFASSSHCWLSRLELQWLPNFLMMLCRHQSHTLAEKSFLMWIEPAPHPAAWVWSSIP